MRRRSLEMMVVAGSAAWVLSGLPVRGAELHTQGFESLAAGDLNGRDGYTAMAQADVAAGGLSYVRGDVSFPGGSNSVSFTSLVPANNWVFSRTFAAQSGTVYFSVAMTWTGQTGDDMLLFGLSDDVHKTPVALRNSAGIHININGTFTSGLINGRMRANSTTETTSTSTGKAGGNSTVSPQFIVGSLSKVSSSNYNTLKLWVNPGSYTEGAPDVTVTRDIGISSGLDTFFYFSGAANESDETMKVDNLRIGTTWADVMPSPRRGTVVTIR